MSKKLTLEPRSGYVMVHTAEKIKEQLERIADERGWSLSLLCDQILREWLKEGKHGQACKNEDA